MVVLSVATNTFSLFGDECLTTQLINNVPHINNNK